VIRLIQDDLRLNVEAERFALLLRIQEVPGSNLGPETGYLTDAFYRFSQSFRANVGIGQSHKLGHDRFLAYPSMIDRLNLGYLQYR
jgi:hypothetical protein